MRVVIVSHEACEVQATVDDRLFLVVAENGRAPRLYGGEFTIRSRYPKWMVYDWKDAQDIINAILEKVNA